MVKVLKRLFTAREVGEIRYSRAIGPHFVPRR